MIAMIRSLLLVALTLLTPNVGAFIAPANSWVAPRTVLHGHRLKSPSLSEAFSDPEDEDCEIDAKPNCEPPAARDVPHHLKSPSLSDAFSDLMDEK
jgi:hypothetical protein